MVLMEPDANIAGRGVPSAIAEEDPLFVYCV